MIMPSMMRSLKVLNVRVEYTGVCKFAEQGKTLKLQDSMA